MDRDPTTTNPDLYHVLFENDRVRVLEYRDTPGARTEPHHHPDSVLCAMVDFTRRISTDGRSMDVGLSAGEARWMPAQEHVGENIGETPTHAIIVELKEAAGALTGPTSSEPPR